MGRLVVPLRARDPADRDDAQDVVRIPAGVLERDLGVDRMADHHDVAQPEPLPDSFDIVGVGVEGDPLGVERRVRRCETLRVDEMPQVDVDELQVPAQVLREDPRVADAGADDDARRAFAFDHISELSSRYVDDPRLDDVLRGQRCLRSPRLRPSRTSPPGAISTEAGSVGRVQRRGRDYPSALAGRQSTR
jgi:hypothetical protein